MNAALLAELRAGRPVFPAFDVTWRARGYTIATGRYARGGAMMADGPPCKGIVPTAGFKECSYGPGMKGNTLVAARTSVKLNDADGSIQAMLETYDPRGSVALVRWVSPFLVEADWEPIFTGVVEDWKIVGNVVEVLLKTNDAPLQSPGPKPIFSRSDWPSAYDATTWGTAMALVTGIHDSYKVTGRGMVPAVNVKWDEDGGRFWWHASIGNLKTIPRIYYDGAVKETGFSVIRGTYGGVFQTIITVDAANIPVTVGADDKAEPAPDAVVSFDCEGPGADGTTVGDSVTNPVAQLRAFLNTYVFRDVRNGRWATADADQIDTATWDATEDYFDLYGYEGAFRLGGGEAEQALQVFEAFLKAHRWVKAWWTPTGKIALAVIPHADPPLTGDWINAATKVADKDFVYSPGDRREVLSGIVSPYLYSHSEQKYLGSYEAHDIGVLPEEERVSEEIENPFSQGRYDQT